MQPSHTAQESPNAMSAPKHQYLLRGEITATAPLSVTYVGLDGKLPRTPHGEVFLNSGTLRGPLRKAALRVAKEQVNDALYARGRRGHHPRGEQRGGQIL